jgi:hypothetical protein
MNILQIILMSENGASLIVVCLLGLVFFLGFNGYLSKKDPDKEKEVYRELDRIKKNQDYEARMKLKKEISKQLEKKEFYSNGKLKTHFYFNKHEWNEDSFSEDGNLFQKKEINEWHKKNEYTLKKYESDKEITEEWSDGEIWEYIEYFPSSSIMITYDPKTRKVIKKVNIDTYFE